MTNYDFVLETYITSEASERMKIFIKLNRKDNDINNYNYKQKLEVLFNAILF